MKMHYACRDINNFGDIVPVYVYSKLGIDVEWSDVPSADLFAGGSILQEAKETNTVLCCGFGSPDEICETPKKILSVRGKLTRDRLIELGIDCPEVYQDMVDLLPGLFYPKVEKVYSVGFLPHYVDYEYCQGMGDVVIDICSGVENVVTEVLKCHEIFTSSLHGIILAETYGIKWTWFIHNELASPYFKFQDYFSRIGKNVYPVLL